ncbi:hypothetical protein PR202_gb17756 [Eleusine coracana subsp. coracana]|uniref:MAT1 centre domain-containing protein n=1 Tax=Eleusine coracana subsp. coracana TaxID=191504 RepID=A0AAV5F4H1_ELECO|nr:hypothetical protein PR202_gb17756 [Eleusine coracana subsp. coracana]
MVVTSGGSGNPWAKEMTIRRRMARMCALRPELSRFNKTQEHFPSLRDYNDYLEEVEGYELLGAPRASVGERELKVSMRLLLFLVGWLNLVLQVWSPNQSAVHQILFKGTMKRPGDYARREQHGQGAGPLK